MLAVLLALAASPGASAEKITPRRRLEGERLNVYRHASTLGVVEDSYIVTLCEASNREEDALVGYIKQTDEDELLPAWHSKVKSEIRPKRENAYFRVVLKDTTAEAAGDLATLASVCGVEQNGLVEAYEAYSWGTDRVDQPFLPLDNIYNPPAGRTGMGVDVYVVDTGLDPTHTEFDDNDSREVLNMWDFYNPVTDPKVNNDAHGHGTHCAGTVGGSSVGVAPGANIYGVKVLSDDGYGSLESILGALEWIADRVTNGKPSVVSMSLGGPGIYESEKQAIDELVGLGVVVVVAAGNSADDACAYSPAFVPSAITVGSTTIGDLVSGFSNYGTCMDIYAPGSSITSALSGTTNQYASWSGTSMACPHVAGITALYFESKAMTPNQVVSTMQCSAIPDLLNVVEGGGWSNDEPRYLAQVPASTFPVYEEFNPGECNTPAPTWSPAPTYSHAPSPQPTYSQKPTPLYTGDSCAGHCGFQSTDGSCYCDDVCEEYGDCCDDYVDVCEGLSPTNEPTMKPTMEPSSKPTTKPTMMPTKEEKGTCYSAKTEVAVRASRETTATVVKRLADVKVGDQILKVGPKAGARDFATIIGLPHSATSQSSFDIKMAPKRGGLRHTEVLKRVEATAYHTFIRCHVRDETGAAAETLVQVKDIKSGDCLHTIHGDNLVKSITEVPEAEAAMHDTYTIVTEGGSSDLIMVGDLVAHGTDASKAGTMME